MEGIIEVLVPVLIAGYTAVGGWYECTGVKDLRPIAENMCGDLRQALNDSCATVVSLPIPQVSTSISVRRSLVLPQLSDVARTAAKDSYVACSRFWGGETDLETYKSELTKSASLLSIALKRSSSEKASRDAEHLANILKQQGVSPQVLQSTVTEAERNLNKCGSTISCAEEQGDNYISKVDLLAVKDTLEERIATVQGELSKSSQAVSESVTALDAKVTKLLAEVVALVPLSTTRLKFVTDIYFGQGRSDISPSLCRNLVSLVAASMTTKTQSVAIFGYADTSGSASANKVLSKLRAASVEACLNSNRATHIEAINVQGEGQVKTLQYAPGSMRRASIYLNE